MRAALLAFGLLALPLVAAGQVRDCELTRSESVSGSELSDGTSITQVRGPMAVRCAGGVSISADQAILFQPQGERRFIGNVVYRDSTQTITTDYLVGYGPEERILARGNVHFTDLVSGSVVTGYEMERFARTFPAGEPRTVVRGRPHAVLRDAPAAAADTAPPFTVDADSMIMRGRGHVRALGAVALRRGDLHGVGVEALYDAELGELELLGAGAAGRPGALPRATLDAETFDLAADRVVAQLVEEEVRHMSATGEAVLTGEQASIQGPRIELFFTAGVLDRLVGVARMAASERVDEPAEGVDPVTEAEPEPGVPALPRRRERVAPPARTERAAAMGEPEEVPEERPRVRAVAEGLRMVSDSLEILAPGEIVQQVTAVGEAFAERLPAAGDAPAEGAESVPDIVARDWIRGDTIVGWFTDGPPPAPGDSAERVLERLVAVGGGQPATTLHRMQGESGGEDVSYMAARRITLLLRDGEVADVQAEGPVKGLYLTRDAARPAATPPPGGAQTPPPEIPPPGRRP